MKYVSNKQSFPLTRVLKFSYWLEKELVGSWKAKWTEGLVWASKVFRSHFLKFWCSYEHAFWHGSFHDSGVWIRLFRICITMNEDIVASSCSVLVQPKSLEHYLSQEEPRLLNHLKNSGALAQLPYNLWFRRCFAGCLPESSLQRSVYC